MKNVIKNRDSNIELLRIILIIMIIVHHLIVHGQGFSEIGQSNLELDKIKLIQIVIESFVIIGVNCFIFIAGYYKIKFKSSKIINIIVQGVFYSLVINLILIVFFNHPITMKGSILAIIPMNAWWFINYYLLLNLLAPYLNILIDYTNKIKQFYLIGILAFIIYILGGIGIVETNMGYSLINFIFIYLLGRVFRENVKDISRRISCIGYIITSLLIIVLVIGTYNILGSKTAWRLFGYDNPLITISSIFFFYIFKSIKFKSNNIINWIASSTLGVYMLHDYILLRRYMRIIFKMNIINLYLHIIMSTLIIFLVCLFIDKIREYIFRRINYKIMTIELLKKIDKYLE